MKSIKFRYILLLASLLIACSAAMGAYQVGDTVADFTLPDAYGNSVSFSNYNGMVVMLNFWTST